MKAFLNIVLAGSLAATSASILVADDTATQSTPTTPAQAEPAGTAPVAPKAPKAERGERMGRGKKSEAMAGGAKVGEAAPNFTLKTADGKDWSLSDAKGKVVVLEWVNPNCPVCVRVSSDGTVANTVKGCKDQYPDMVYVAINSSAAQPDSLEATGSYLAKHKLELPALLDADGKVGLMYGAKTTPHCYVIDAAGVLVYQGAIDDNQSGSGKTNYVVNAVTQLKAGEKVSPSETKPYGCGVKYKK